MILVVGSPDSGKSTLCQAMAAIGANSAIIGQTTFAAATREMDESRGLFILDDLETIGTSGRNQNIRSNDINQALKISYKKETSWRQITDMKGGSLKKLNLFGVKIINNTSGADHILGSRMLRIQTRSIPPELLEDFELKNSFNKKDLDNLRNELHTWTFENVDKIVQVYRNHPRSTERASEISLPLRIFSEICGNLQYSTSLNKALNEKITNSSQFLSPEDILKKAVFQLVQEGYFNVSATQLILEIKTIFDRGYNIASDEERIKLENPAWIGKLLRKIGAVSADALPRRERIFGVSLRIYPIKNGYISQMFSKSQNKNFPIKSKKAFDFCKDCITCSYSKVGCGIMPVRLKSQAQNRSV